MKHYGLMATDGEIITDNHIKSSDIQSRINMDLPRGVSPFITILEEIEEQSTNELLRINFGAHVHCQNMIHGSDGLVGTITGQVLDPKMRGMFLQ